MVFRKRTQQAGTDISRKDVACDRFQEAVEGQTVLLGGTWLYPAIDGHLHSSARAWLRLYFLSVLKCVTCGRVEYLSASNLVVGLRGVLPSALAASRFQLAVLGLGYHWAVLLLLSPLAVSGE